MACVLFTDDADGVLMMPPISVVCSGVPGVNQWRNFVVGLAVLSAMNPCSLGAAMVLANSYQFTFLTSCSAQNFLLNSRSLIGPHRVEGAAVVSVGGCHSLRKLVGCVPR